MTSFEEYLAGEGLKTETAGQHAKHVRYLLSWLAEVSLDTGQLTYREILDFVDAQSSAGRSINHINRMLVSLRYYFQYLIKHQEAQHNPAAGIVLKGSMRSIPRDLLTRQELEALYDGYKIKDDRTYRNKVIVGLLTIQGLTRLELETLRPEHIKLREGSIHVPVTGKLNARVLTLAPHQILDLSEYMQQVRPRLQQGSDRLFCGRNNLERLSNSLLHLNHALRKINPKLKNAVQIRQSVITEWLKEKDLRQVQYMAGHRYVSSTERYQTNNLEDLKEALSKHHPLK